MIHPRAIIYNINFALASNLNLIEHFTNKLKELYNDLTIFYHYLFLKRKYFTMRGRFYESTS